MWRLISFRNAVRIIDAAATPDRLGVIETSDFSNTTPGSFLMCAEESRTLIDGGVAPGQLV